MTSTERSTIDQTRRYERELNERQREVLDLLTAGRTNPEIAAALGITLDGAKYHVSEILTRLGFATREDAAEYWRWRNRPAARLRRSLRGVLALPAAKVAAGVGTAAVVAGVGVTAWLIFGGGGQDDPPERVPPFELTARMVATQADPLTVGTSISGSTSTPVLQTTTATIRWSYRDLTHWRWDIVRTDPALDASTFVVAADGRSQLAYDSATNTVVRTPYAPFPGGWAPPPGLSVLLGPLPYDSIDAFVAGWSTTTSQSAPRHAAIVGEEIVMGRRTTIVEFGPTWSSTDSNAGDVSGGTARLWIDAERMFALRETADGGEHGSYSVELTTLEHGVPKGDVSSSFTPPGDARVVDSTKQNSVYLGNESSLHGGSIVVNGTPAATLHTPGGFLKPAYVPPLYGVADEGTSRSNSNEVIAAESLLRLSGAGPYLGIQQRKRADGLPPGLITNDRTTVNGNVAYRGTTGVAKTLAWQQGSLSVLLTSDALSYDELERIANSMTLQ